MSWLAHGGELARALKGEEARHRDVIWMLLTEAVETIDKLPDQERRWLSSGARSGGWNMVGMSIADLKELERIRLLSAMKPYDGSSRASFATHDIDRALGVMEWLRWCNRAAQPEPLKKAAVVLARGGDQEIVHKVYCPNRKPNRQNVHEIKTRTTGFIITGLREDLSIIPGEGVTFEEVHF